jgi:integrase
MRVAVFRHYRCGPAGCAAEKLWRGLRQGEVFGFAVDDIDSKDGWIHVNRQVRLAGTKPVFALPEGNKIPSVPLLAQLAATLKTQMKEFPPVAVTLPWAKPDGELKPWPPPA